MAKAGRRRGDPSSVVGGRDKGNQLRIVHYNLTTTSKEGGVETFVWELSRQQARRGHYVTVIGGAGRVERAIEGVRVLRYPFVDRMRWRSLPPLRRHF